MTTPDADTPPPAGEVSKAQPLASPIDGAAQDALKPPRATPPRRRTAAAASDALASARRTRAQPAAEAEATEAATTLEAPTRRRTRAAAAGSAAADAATPGPRRKTRAAAAGASAVEAAPPAPTPAAEREAAAAAPEKPKPRRGRTRATTAAAAEHAASQDEAIAPPAAVASPATEAPIAGALDSAQREDIEDAAPAIAEMSAGDVPPRTTPAAAPERLVLADLSMAELEALVAEMGQPPFRARQVFTWLYRDLTFDIEQMRTLPKPFRSALAARAVTLPLTLTTERRSADGLTIKALCELARGGHVETVLMLYAAHGRDRGRRTVCVSTQIGCAVGCPFCATGQSGFGRNLSAGEIVGQVLAVAERYGSERQHEVGRVQGITNVVFMGQGEPFLNFEATWKAIELLNSPYGFNLGARRMTISTAGVIPGIAELARRPLQVNLAVSLHAPNDELRNELVPINKRYPLTDLMAACRAYVAATGRRVTFEYVMIDGLNDAPALAHQLADLVEGLLCHVNLIPLNPTSLFGYPGSPMPAVEAFQRVLLDRGIPTTVRVERGQDIDAACGQLRATVEERAREAARRRLEASGLPLTPTPPAAPGPATRPRAAEPAELGDEAGPPASARPQRGPTRWAGQRPAWRGGDAGPQRPPQRGAERPAGPRPGARQVGWPGAGRDEGRGDRPAAQRPWQPGSGRPWQPPSERPAGGRAPGSGGGPRHDWRERRGPAGGWPGASDAGRGYGSARPPSNARPPGRPVSRLDSRYRQSDEQWGRNQPGGSRPGERRGPSDRGWRPPGPGGRGEMPPRPEGGHRPSERDREGGRPPQWRPPGPRPGRRPPRRSA
jgi:23S rRNA (adenine2503-C2)-methyltransferase